MASLDRVYPNVVEFARPLTPGARIGAEELEVLEVATLASTLTVAGRSRPVFIALHQKRRDGGMLTMFVCLEDKQRAWSL